MRRTSLPIITFALLAASWHMGATAAGSGPSPSSADAASLASFRLTDDFIDRYQAYQEEAAKKPCELSPMLAMKSDAGNRSLDQMVATFDAQPGVHAALQRHGLTARDLILGMSTLMGAAVQDIAKQHPEMVKKGQISSKGTISPANMAVYHRHKDELHRHQMQLGRAQLKANGGKLPSCLSGK